MSAATSCLSEDDSKIVRARVVPCHERTPPNMLKHSLVGLLANARICSIQRQELRI